MDYGKFKYAQSKKSHQKTHQQKLKEIRIRPKTGDHDIDTKIQQAKKFLEHNDKVQVNVLFRGREMQHVEEGHRVMNQLLEALQDSCKLESPSRMEGRRLVALLAPKSAGKSAAPPAKPTAPKPPAAPRPPAAAAPSPNGTPGTPAPKPAPTTATAPSTPTAPKPSAPAAPAAKPPAAAPAPSVNPSPKPAT